MNELMLLSSSVGKLLSSQHLKLVTAESCTGGFLSKIITDVPGCSVWFDRGFVVYSEQSKQELLNVSAETLSQFGAVSQETVEAMAKGALKQSQAQVSVAITGIAGPGGATLHKPVGFVWFAWAGPAWSLISSSYRFEGDREEVRKQSVYMALKKMEALLTQHD